MKEWRRNRGIAALIAAVCIMLLQVLLPVKALAADREYSVPAADFTMEILENGDVNVTENWEVDYEKGTFTRFYKDIYGEDLPAEETYTLDPGSIEVTIDGVPCAYTDDTSGRPDDTFHFAEEDGTWTVECYKRSQGVTRRYGIRYTLRGAVKHVDGAYHLVTFRMVGYNFEKRIGSLTARVVSPAGSSVDIRNARVFESVSASGNTADITAGADWKGVFKIKARVDGAKIAGAVPLSGGDLSNVDDEKDTGRAGGGDDGPGFLIPVVGGIFASIAVLGALIGRGREARRKKKLAREVEKNLESDPAFYTNILNRWTPRLSPMEFAFGCEYTPSRNVLYAYLNYMINSGILEVNGDGRCRVVRREGLTEEETRVLDYLDRAGVADQEPDGIVDPEALSENIQRRKADLTGFETEIKKALEKKAAAKLSPEEKKAFWKDQKSVRDYMEYLYNTGGNVDGIAGAAFLYVLVFNNWISRDPFLTGGEQTPGGRVRDFMYDLYRAGGELYEEEDAAARASSDSGSGCSSCSSCSSCGGGGAD